MAHLLELIKMKNVIQSIFLVTLLVYRRKHNSSLECKKFVIFTTWVADLCVRLCSAERAGLVTLSSCSFSPQCWTGWSWLSHNWTVSWMVNWCQSVPPGLHGAWLCLGTRGPSPAACTRGPLRGPETKHGAPHSVRGCSSWIQYICFVELCNMWI